MLTTLKVLKLLSHQSFPHLALCFSKAESIFANPSPGGIINEVGDQNFGSRVFLGTILAKSIDPVGKFVGIPGVSTVSEADINVPRTGSYRTSRAESFRTDRKRAMITESKNMVGTIKCTNKNIHIKSYRIKQTCQQIKHLQYPLFKTFTHQYFPTRLHENWKRPFSSFFRIQSAYAVQRPNIQILFRFWSANDRDPRVFENATDLYMRINGRFIRWATRRTNERKESKSLDQVMEILVQALWFLANSIQKGDIRKIVPNIGRRFCLNHKALQIWWKCCRFLYNQLQTKCRSIVRSSLKLQCQL